MTTRDIANKLRSLKKETPQTCKFDKEHGQPTNRWWDKLGEYTEGFSRQQYHVVCYFMCRYYNGTGYQSTCRKESCEVCYCKEGYKRENPINNRDSKFLFAHMNKPEMYLWIIEALGILEPEELASLIDDIIEAISGYPRNNPPMGKVRSKIVEHDISIARIEHKLEELAADFTT